MENQVLCRKPEETEEEYCKRIIASKSVLNLNWQGVANILNEELGYSYSSDRYRKRYSDSDENIEEYEDDYSDIIFDDDTDLDSGISSKIIELRKERAKLSDERTQITRLARNMAREETLKEIAHDAVESISKEKVFETYKKQESGDEIGILCLSDVHYGIEIDNAFNKYDCDIAKKRLQQLRDETITKLEKDNIKDLCVVNLGDLIAGRIHLPIRLNSRIDTITQTIEMSEIVAEMLHDFSEHFNVHYASTSDNHSRLESGAKDDSWNIENLQRITNWYLKERCKDFVTFIDNEFGDDICTFNVGHYKVASVHGDRPGDKQTRLIQNLSMFTQTHYDLILTAHKHHFSADEDWGTMMIANGSVMGLDDYASDLRAFSQPSQNLIIMSNKSPVEAIYRIILD